jgi:hypothetical protein
MSVGTANGQGSKQIVASDFRESVRGKLTDVTIDGVVRALHAATVTYPVTITFEDLVLYATIRVTVQGGRRFDGNFGVIDPNTPVGGLPGTLYTDNLDRLYSSTRSFQILTTPVYLAVLFFDGSHDLLAHVMSAGAAPIGVGAGAGEWQ